MIAELFLTISSICCFVTLSNTRSGHDSQVEIVVNTSLIILRKVRLFLLFFINRYDLLIVERHRTTACCEARRHLGILVTDMNTGVGRCSFFISNKKIVILNKPLSMELLQFDTKLTSNSEIKIPDNLKTKIELNKEVKILVILTGEKLYDDSEDDEWNKLSGMQ